MENIIVNSAIGSWMQGNAIAHYDPWLCYVSVTNLCTSECSVCPRSRTMRSKQGVMSYELFKKIVDELPGGVQKIYLMKQGEPFINDKLEEMVRYLRRKRPNVYIAIHTNGVIAQRNRVKNILPFINALGVSISAISKDMYKRVHGKDFFVRVTKNLSHISDLSLALPKQQRPHIFIDYVEQQKNRSESQESVVSFYKDNFPGLSSVDFHWVFNFQGEIEEGNLGIYTKLPENKFPRCVFPWCSITFCYDGLVSYCFVEPRENCFLGDISVQSFREIWNGAKYKNFRTLMVNKKFTTLKEQGYFCKHCSWLWSMKSQSPRNLCGGYSMQHKDTEAFGDILELPFKKIINVAIDNFLSGEIHRAMGIAKFINSTCCEKLTANKARKLLSYCENIVSLYKDLPLWQTQLNKEKIDVEGRKCRYYNISE